MTKRRWLLLAFIALAIVVGGISTASIQTLLGSSDYPTFSLYNKGLISEVVIRRGETFVSKETLNSEGSTLYVTVLDDHFEIPWTLYLPFFQSGEMKAKRRISIQLEGHTFKEDRVMVQSKIRRFALFPALNLEDNLRKELARCLRRSVAAGRCCGFPACAGA